MLTAPRAIARVKCWNPERMDEPVRYGVKMAFTCVFVEVSPGRQCIARDIFETHSEPSCLELNGIL